MSEFDAKARQWDSDIMHMNRSKAIADEIVKIIPSDSKLRALEYGAGTGILSFLLKDKFAEIVLMDSSKEMIKVCEEKCDYHKTYNIKPLWFDLEHDDFDEKFDIIYNQMVLHHVMDIDLILSKFYSLLNPGGILVIADLYSEDGSFHGPGSNVHLGFDPVTLIKSLEAKGLKNGKYQTCFLVKRPTGIEYPIFFMSAVKE